MREMIEHIQREAVEIFEVSWKQVAGGAALVGALTTGIPDTALAHTHHKHHQVAPKHYTDNDYIDAVVGEAADGGYQGMLDIACAIRNRIKDPRHSKNPLHQVYGYHAPHNKGESKETWDLARKAWTDSANQDTVNGATLWGNASDVQSFNKNWDMSKVAQTVSRLGHTFFKEK